jgi:Cephalosporin hydroxylase
MEIKYVDRPGSCRILPVGSTTAGQVPAVVVPFSEIIQDFDLIIELGYYWGGFTLWFNQNKKKGAKVIGYDITDLNREVIDPKEIADIEYRIGDCFDSNVIQEISNLISSSGKTLIFCDNGVNEKGKSFDLYAPLLKEGDVIMVHDYYDDTKMEPYNSFSESEGWAYNYEVKYTDIEKTIENYSLSEYNYEDFRKCLIGSFIKNSLK